VNSNLLPHDETTDRLLSRVGLEKGLALSMGMIFLGFASSLGAVIYWGENRFGDIDPTRSMRLVIPGAMLFTLGFEIFFASFFISILNTRLKQGNEK